MPCAFQAERPFPFHELGPGCQFTDEAVFHAVDGQDWCRFHIPVEDAKGVRTAKAE
jgi:hypothetical protein